MLSFVSSFFSSRGITKRPKGFQGVQFSNHCVVSCIARSFDEALAKRYVLDFGRVVNLNKDGHAFPSTDLQLSAAYQPGLNVIVRAILGQLHNTVVRAIFVRGSLATGNFQREGCFSDVDLIIFTDDELNNDEKSKVQYQVQKIIRNDMQVSSFTDISFQNGKRQKRQPFSSFSSDRGQHSEVTFPMTSSMISILRHYSVPLYGYLRDVGVSTGSDIPFMDLAKDIREQERLFKFSFKQAEASHDSVLQVIALQWICKRCLRAIADECCRQTLVHCRDLVPCYRLAIEIFPQYSQTLLNILQLACAKTTEDEFAGFESRYDFVEFGTDVVSDAVEIVEHVFLKRCFPDEEIERHMNSTSRRALKQAAVPVSLWMAITNPIRQTVSAMKNNVLLHLSGCIDFDEDEQGKSVFMRCDLPPLAISAKPFGNQHGVIKQIENGGKQEREKMNELSDLLGHFPHPVLFRNAAGLLSDDINIGTTEMILKNLVKQHVKVDCRISPSNTVIFCRSQHPDISDGTFTQTSILKSIPPREAIDRVRANYLSSSINYDRKECTREHIYIQTQVSKKDKKFLVGSLGKHDIAQDERIWISTHGTVSSLHYDASHSALFQRTGCKRMILFPNEALESLGIYPLHHPLHRRARVNLSRKQSVIFEEFWKSWAGEAEVVQINAGDLLLFPPCWAHYTESLSEDEDELCISHTFRYW